MSSKIPKQSTLKQKIISVDILTTPRSSTPLESEPAAAGFALFSSYPPGSVTIPPEIFANSTHTLRLPVHEEDNVIRGLTPVKM